MDDRRYEALGHVKRLKTDFGTVTEVSKYLGINVGHISRVFNPGYVSPMVVRSLVAKDLMEPVEKRPRVWMPTNNLKAALGKLVEHYPEIEPSISHLIKER